MIQEFVKKFEEGKAKLEALFVAKHPDSYEDIVRNVISVITDEDGYRDSPDPERIHRIDDGDYQGTLLFVIGAKGYQPHNYWFVKVYYGSCSGCDTFQAVRGYSDEPPTPEQVKDYMGLALNVVQGLKSMNEPE